MNSQMWWYIGTLTKKIKSTIVARPNKRRGRPPKIRDDNLSIALGKLNENN